jgi:dienelactone hydrolase
MSFKKLVFLSACAFLWIFSPVSHARGDDGCQSDWRPLISFVDFESPDLELTHLGLVDIGDLTIKGKLKLPVRYDKRKRCYRPRKNLSAVVILHGSSGVDSRGDFYARALNAAGIATFEIDMWEARGIDSAADRPPVPLINYPDAFGALRFLSDHPNIDPDRIGIMGFSWGGAVSLASATEPNASLFGGLFGGNLRFAAHVAHYPVCWASNSKFPETDLPIPGSEFRVLTGAPILIQIGEKDDYDNGPDECFDLKNDLDQKVQKTLLTVISYEGAFHAWDRLQVPFKAYDLFANLGRGGEVEVVPDVDQAYKSRKKVVRFFRRHL